MNGPGQFLGSVAANLPAGTRDTWSNNISEDALIQRKQENDAAAAAWAARKAAHDPTLTPEWQTEIQVETTRVAAFADVPTRGSLIKAGDGILTLTGTNSYSGGTTFAGGILSVARDANLGAAAGALPLTAASSRSPAPASPPPAGPSPGATAAAASILPAWTIPSP
ncbi:autotransporter-associated beta strand repeat-containing protein [Methylobacterium persicinum]